MYVCYLLILIVDFTNFSSTIASLDRTNEAGTYAFPRREICNVAWSESTRRDETNVFNLISRRNVNFRFDRDSWPPARPESVKITSDKYREISRGEEKYRIAERNSAVDPRRHTAALRQHANVLDLVSLQLEINYDVEQRRRNTIAPKSRKLLNDTSLHERRVERKKRCGTMNFHRRGEMRRFDGRT